MSEHAKALRWITRQLELMGVPFQAVGGLAARGYGARRPLQDLDFYIPTSRLDQVAAALPDHLLRPPERHRDEHWDLTFMKLGYVDCDIELGGADDARYFDRHAQRWRGADIDFTSSVDVEILGVRVPTIPLDQLRRYKSGLDRDVDRQDLEEIGDRFGERLVPFDYQPALKSQLVELRPLRAQDFDDLYSVASDPLIWEQHPAKDRCEEEGFRRFFAEALESGGALVAIDTETGRIIGSSRFHAWDAENSEVEIGWTFLARSYWGGRYNGEVKRLMLRHALRFVEAVVFLVGPENVRSQRAVEKIGGVRAGRRTDASGNDSLVYRLTESDAAKAGAI
jgi:RimJ/RimL family protein N-acetyltransferase